MLEKVGGRRRFAETVDADDRAVQADQLRQKSATPASMATVGRRGSTLFL